MVTVHDLRGEECPLSLVHDSIHIVQNIPITKTNFDSDEDIRENYYPLVEQQVIANVPGAAKVQIFDSYRSNPGSGVIGWHAVYGGFNDPWTSSNAPGRWSIEIFALVFGS